MNKVILVEIITIMIVLISCEKGKDPDPDSAFLEIYDTLKPLDYFPAFPGSYWIYNPADTLRVNENHEKCIYNAAGYTGYDFDTIVLPKFAQNSIFGEVFIKGYPISNNNSGNYRDLPFREILSETEGAYFYISSYWTVHQSTGKTI